MTHLETHINRVEAWAEARGLYETDSTLVQFGKMVEEVGELIMAIGKDDREEIKDAVGDIRVCLINVCRIVGADFTQDYGFTSVVQYDTYWTLRAVSRLALELLEGGDETGRAVAHLKRNILAAAHHYNLTLSECDDAAWSQIKDRTGKTVGGEFVKDEA